MSKKQRPRPPRDVKFSPERSDEEFTTVLLNGDDEIFIEVNPDEVFLHNHYSSVSVPLNAIVFALRLHYWRTAK